MIETSQRAVIRRRAIASGRLCPWCKTSPLEGRRDRKFCSTRCRQASWRFGVQPSPRDPDATGVDARRFAYADPPYPGKAGLYPEDQEVDHALLITKLQEFDGWALSTSQAALRDVLSSCPAAVRVAVWIRSCRTTRSTRPLNAWEPVIYRPLRPLATDHAQVLIDVLDYRGRYRAYPGALVGMKPPQFAVWMFGLVAAVPGDEFHDLFPGSGAVTRAWERFSVVASGGRDGSVE